VRVLPVEEDHALALPQLHALETGGADDVRALCG